MEDKEKLIVYSNSSSVFTYSAEIRPNFKISVSQSQGFAWNQDLFATQYQQSYKVVYDAHEDDFDDLITKIKDNLQSSFNKKDKMKSKSKFTTIAKKNKEGPVCVEERIDDDSNSEHYQRIQMVDSHEFPRRNPYTPVWDHDLQSDENDSTSEEENEHDVDMVGGTQASYVTVAVMDRPRRKSERSISFVEDSKTGDYRYQIGKVDVVEVDSDTPENKHIKWLIT
ncbi:hypothetical protein SMKI_04G0720 [Saccharomyces mikatae IFO 1815]|uniref:Ugx2p n=1 Tax=Saccharomyces mikatae IFO 1815 TaxID=226126 RepID=A0AA35NGK0_SACMI|nr:uncharacterized protein SMKI_04G0720 [Saccharomyces mikatae IFO 1815]CAI4037741.1 hypothetical protein SMKI_04G0720 [Saccharomyces mikatae IFO 1815]